MTPKIEGCSKGLLRISSVANCTIVNPRLLSHLYSPVTSGCREGGGEGMQIYKVVQCLTCGAAVCFRSLQFSDGLRRERISGCQLSGCWLLQHGMACVLFDYMYSDRRLLLV